MDILFYFLMLSQKKQMKNKLVELTDDRIWDTGYSINSKQEISGNINCRKAKAYAWFLSNGVLYSTTRQILHLLQIISPCIHTELGIYKSKCIMVFSMRQLKLIRYINIVARCLTT